MTLKTGKLMVVNVVNGVQEGIHIHKTKGGTNIPGEVASYGSEWEFTEESAKDSATVTWAKLVPKPGSSWKEGWVKLTVDAMDKFNNPIIHEYCRINQALPPVDGDS